MYKINFFFTFHHYWGAFCQGAFVLGGLCLGGFCPVPILDIKGAKKGEFQTLILKKKFIQF